MEVFIGGSRVVSILYIGLPASGIIEAGGDQKSKFSFFPIGGGRTEIPRRRKMIPAMEIGAAKPNEKAEESDRTTPAPSAMQIHPDITKFSPFVVEFGSPFTYVSLVVRL
tara:strand:- start:2 stop:331 length:330 start_codon:yes stop_codon:yes gene_type:complete